MDQTNALADALLKSPALSGALTSGADDSSGTGLDGMFSDLLAQNSDTQAVAASQTIAPVTSSASSSATTPVVPTDSGNNGLIQNLGALSSTLHKVLNLLHQQQAAATLSHKAADKQPMAAASSTSSATQAPSQNQGAQTATAATTSTPTTTPVSTPAATVASATAAAQTKSATTIATTVAATTSTNAIAAATTAAASTATVAVSTSTAGASTDDSSGDDLNKLAEIVAELLLLTQFMMQNLHQIETVGTGTDTTKTDAKLAAISSDAVAKTADILAATSTATPSGAAASTDPDNLFASLLADPATALQDIMDALKALSAETTTSTAAAATVATTTSTTASAAAATATVTTDPLTQLMSLLQDTAQQLMPVAEAIAQPASAQVTAVDQSTLPTVSTDLKSLLADTWATLSIAADEQKAAAAAVTNTTSTAAVTTPDITAQLTALDTGLKDTLALLQPKKGSDPATQAATAAAQITTEPLAALSTRATPASNETADTTKPAASDNWQSQLFAQPSASAPQQTQSSGQVFANASAFVTAGDKNTGGDDYSGGNSGSFTHDGSASSASNNSSAALSAEGAQATGTYNFASQLSAFRAANGGTTGLPSVVDQVILQMNRGVKNGNDQMSLQLQPGDLGKITVKLDFGADGKVQGTVTADNPKTLDMLQKDSRSLERALQDAGLRADPGSLQFSLGGQTNQNNAGQTAAQKGDGANGTEDASQTAGDEDLVDLGAIAETYYITPGGVNIRV